MIRNKIVMKTIGVNPKTIIHIGAGAGEDRDLYRALGTKKLIWVEANIELYNKLVSKFPSDTCFNFRATSDNPKVKSKVKSMDKSLDLVFSNSDLPHPILLIIDTDGDEIEILQGASKLLDKVSFLVIEQHRNWDNGIWYKTISEFCQRYGFSRTLARPSWDKTYEDVLWTRFSTTRIIFTRCLDSIFFVLKLFKHIINQRHFPDSYFNCEKCNHEARKLAG